MLQESTDRYVQLIDLHIVEKVVVEKTSNLNDLEVRVAVAAVAAVVGVIVFIAPRTPSNDIIKREYRSLPDKQRRL